MVKTWNAFNNNTGLEVGVFCLFGSFALCSLLVTVYLIFGHVKHWIDPNGQRSIVRILLMIPIYSVVSFLATIFGDYALYFVFVRDCYEPYVFYQFFCLLVHYLQVEEPTRLILYGEEGEEEGTDCPNDPGQIIANYGETALAFPFCCGTYQPGPRAFMHIKRCSLQYVFIKPVCSAIAILLHMLGLYHPGSLSTNHGYFWIAMILNISATISIYFIFLFYELIKKKIYAYNPLLKLISIKILIFFVFWQGIAINVLYYFNVMPAFFGWSTERSSETVQNLLICMEMVALSFFNLHAFSYIGYRTSPGDNTLDIALENLSSVLKQGDMLRETKEAFNPLSINTKEDDKKKHDD